ncbi:MAG: ABC transporter ATP-binding protein [Pyrinomonadaceae bacterium]
MARVTLKNISKIYSGDVRAVSHANAEIEDGEFAVLVGPSGCGKSTLLRMIAGLETISEGELSIGNRIVNHVPARDRDIAMVFQNYALYPHMSVRENMAFGLKMRRFPKDEIAERVNSAAQILDLSHLLERKPHTLSGGQRQRVAVGRAIVRQPQVFLFDEPLSNLDAKLRASTRGELIKLHQQLRTTMIYVTHDQTEAMSMGERIIVMRDGIVQQIGTPMGIYDEPANKFVAGFLGSPPMNFFAGELRREDGELRVSNDVLDIALPSAKRARIESSKQPSGKVFFGIRPEDIFERDAAPHSEAKRHNITAKVEMMEFMGSEAIATCTLGNHTLVARLDRRTDARTGSALNLVFDLERAKIFDFTSEEILA